MPATRIIDEDDAEPELTEAQNVYNVASSQLFNEALYGDCKHWPAHELLTDKGKRQQRAYADVLRAAQTRFEAAVLVKAADYFQSVIDSAVKKPEFNALYWGGVHHTVLGLRAQAADLLKELSDQ